jgi:hypothetical protein
MEQENNYQEKSIVGENDSQSNSFDLSYSSDSEDKYSVAGDDTSVAISLSDENRNSGKMKSNRSFSESSSSSSKRSEYGEFDSEYGSNPDKGNPNATSTTKKPVKKKSPGIDNDTPIKDFSRPCIEALRRLSELFSQCTNPDFSDEKTIKVSNKIQKFSFKI